jgi:hypothetical protein
MSVTMYDGINSLAAGIHQKFPNAAMVAGYINGRYAWTQAEWDLFPHANHVTIGISASANAGDVLDVEAGDATPAQTAGWIRARKAAGYYRPSIYCARAVIPAVRQGTGSYILGRDYDIWVADWTGSPHQVAAPGTPAATCAATQYENTAHYDVSAVYDTRWPHRTAPATELPAPAGISVTLDGFTADFGWGAVRSAKSYLFQVFHHDGAGIYGNAVANEVVTSNHVERFRLPGGGRYAVRVRAYEPHGIWTPWKVF